MGASPARSLARLVADAVADGADALGVAGGDGSLAVVAAAAVRARAAVRLRPHGYPQPLRARSRPRPRRPRRGAVDALVDGDERRIDVAEVNGRLFLNNASLGIYGDAVREPGYRNAKVRTLFQTAESVLGPSGEIDDLEVVDDRGRVHSRPAVVLVSNNPYSLEPRFTRAGRPSLDGGRLGVVVLDRHPPGYAWTTNGRPRSRRTHPRTPGSTGKRSTSRRRSDSRSGRGRCACRDRARGTSARR